MNIPINIWDDYYEEDYIPEGEKQETYIYVEDTDIPLDKRKVCLEMLLNYMNENLSLPGVKMWIELFDSRVKYPKMTRERCEESGFDYDTFHFSRWEIKVENLTHKRRYVLEKELQECGLELDGVPFYIYSES